MSVKLQLWSTVKISVVLESFEADEVDEVDMAIFISTDNNTKIKNLPLITQSWQG